eukprot:15602286-Heterocapsa_arctica.AAC.1
MCPLDEEHGFPVDFLLSRWKVEDATVDHAGVGGEDGADLAAYRCCLCFAAEMRASVDVLG